MQDSIYLDNSATTRVLDEVLAAMLPFQSDAWGNASSIHTIGRQARSAVEEARQRVAIFLGARASEIYFTPNATYSNNAAILGRARYVEENGLGRHIITSSIEHSSVLEPVKHLQTSGWQITILKVDGQGFIDLNELRNAIRPDTSIISIMWGNNEVGTLQPIESIQAIAHDRGIFLHTDAVQVAGKLAIDVTRLGIDSLALSGHKFHAPKGIGILYIKEGVKVAPLLFGGGQEGGLSPGTEGVANIVGIGKAAEIAHAEIQQNHKKLRRLQQILVDELLKDSQIKLTGPRNLNRRVPGHVSVLVEGAVGSDLVLDADVRGVRVSSASACSSGHAKSSHVLEALGVPAKAAEGSMRIVAGKLNTESECRTAARVLKSLIQPEATPVRSFNPTLTWAY